MTVTEITEVTKSRSKVEIDYQFAFVLYKGELRMYHIEKGKDIPEELYKEIKEQLLPKRAKMRAMNLLKSRDYTRRQLSDKLKNGGYSADIAELAVSYVESYGYINDRLYCRDYIECHKENRSRMRIFNDLQKKGIDRELTEEIWTKIIGDNRQELERKQIAEWMRKRKFDPKTADFKEKQKFCAFLYRKGFQIEAIRSVLSLDITSI